MGLSRNEDILQSILDKTDYNRKPESRIEALLIAISDQIKRGGASQEEIKAAVSSYLSVHPELVTGIDETQLENVLKGVFNNG